MSYRVLINGANGRMGQLAGSIVTSLPGFEMVAGCGRHDDLAAAIKRHRAQIVIDFTTADVVYQNTLSIIDAGARPIIGTSGLQQFQVDELISAAQERDIAGIIVPNFSIAAVLLMHFAVLAAPHFKQAEIIEMHHERKVDAPSGTAIRTAELMAVKMQSATAILDMVQTLDGARGAKMAGIPIHSLRLPGILARQQVILGNAGETLMLEYNTLDRQAYVAGIKLACERVMNLKQLVYGLDFLLGLRDGK